MSIHLVHSSEDETYGWGEAVVYQLYVERNLYVEILPMVGGL